MSRVGKKPIVIPQGVECAQDGNHIKVKGPKGQLQTFFTNNVSVELTNDNIIVSPQRDTKKCRSEWGTYRANINNILTGVSTGFTKTLMLEGVGYRAAVQGQELVLQLGYSHEIRFAIPETISVTVEKNTTLIINGIDKDLVGLVAAKIRALRKPEPYKLKGVKYQGEYIMQKEGKKK